MWEVRRRRGSESNATAVKSSAPGVGDLEYSNSVSHLERFLSLRRADLEIYPECELQHYVLRMRALALFLKSTSSGSRGRGNVPRMLDRVHILDGVGVLGHASVRRPPRRAVSDAQKSDVSRYF